MHGMNGVAIYKDVSSETGFPLNTRGTLYLSLTSGERAVLEEMRRIGPEHGYHSELLEPGEAVKLNPAVDPHAINGALFFADDLRIESRHFFEFLLPWMETHLGLERRMGSVAVEAPRSTAACAQILTATGETYLRAARAVVCSGADFRTLFPELFALKRFWCCMLHINAQ